MMSLRKVMLRVDALIEIKTPKIRIKKIKIRKDKVILVRKETRKSE